MAGLSKFGFEIKRLPEIKAEIESALRTAFGDEIDLRAESVFGQLVGVLSLPISELWEEAQNVYLSFDPDYADGVSLDSLAALTGVTRIPATPTTVTAALFGNVDTIVPAGSQARNSNTGDIYNLVNSVAIGMSNLVNALVTVNNVSSNTGYTITINGVPYSITSDANATQDEILLALGSALSSNPIFNQVNVLQEIELVQNTLSEPFSLSVSANLTISQIASPGVFISDIEGAKFLPAGSLDQIQTSVAGWLSVTNPFDGQVGRDIESDSELRLRRRQSVSYPSTATIEAIRSKLLQVPEIQAAKVFENDQSTTDTNGVPPQHIWVIVQGGDASVIADIIYRTKAGGIGTHGTTVVDLNGLNGQIYEIKFQRPTIVPLYVDMTIVPMEGYTSVAPDLIKAAIVQWVTENMEIGEGLKYSRLFTPINSVPGFEVTDLKIGTTPSPTGETSISVDVSDLIVSDTVNILVTVDT